MLIQFDLAVELFFAEEAGLELIDLAAKAEVGFAALDVGGQGFSTAGWQWEQRGEEGGVEMAQINGRREWWEGGLLRE